MDIFKEVSEKADILRVCDLLNIKLNRNHKALCPFHREKTPSFSVLPEKNIFYCFGCNKKGNTITLVKEMLNISALEAAKYLNNNLGLGVDMENRQTYSYVNKYNEKRKTKERFKKWEKNTFVILSKYYRMLKDWKENRILQSPYYEYALKHIDYVEYIINEVFIEGTLKDKIDYRNTNAKEVEEFERVLRTQRP